MIIFIRQNVSRIFNDHTRFQDSLWEAAHCSDSSLPLMGCFQQVVLFDRKQITNKFSQKCQPDFIKECITTWYLSPKYVGAICKENKDFIIFSLGKNATNSFVNPKQHLPTNKLKFIGYLILNCWTKKSTWLKKSTLCGQFFSLTNFVHILQLKQTTYYRD